MSGAAPVPAVSLDASGTTTQTFTCPQAQRFHGFLALSPELAWFGDGFSCRRSHGAQIGHGEILRCLSPSGHGFVIDEANAVFPDL